MKRAHPWILQFMVLHQKGGHSLKICYEKVGSSLYIYFVLNSQQINNQVLILASLGQRIAFVEKIAQFH